MAIELDEVLKLIIVRPRIRSVELIDILNCDLSQIYRALKGHLVAGDIIENPVKTEFGALVTEFTCAEKFKGTETYKKFMLAAPVPAMKDKAAQAAPNIKTNGERAIECILAHGGCAPDAAVREALGIGPGKYTSTWLAREMRLGKLHRDGDFWRIGRKAAEQDLKPSKVVEMVEPSPPMVTQKDRLPIIEETDTAAHEKASESQILGQVQQEVALSAAPALPTIPAAIPSQKARDPERFAEFACARWSTGVLQIRRMGQDIAFLMPNEVEEIFKFYGVVPA